MDEHLQQLAIDDDVVADVIDRIVGLARFANPIELGNTWHELIGQLTTDQQLDLGLALSRALAG